MKTLFLTDDFFKKHDNGLGHPERPERLTAIHDFMRRDGLREQVTRGTFEAAADEQLLLCHTPELVEKVRAMAANGGGRVDADTVVTPHSFEAAKRAVGAAFRAVDAVQSGEADNAFVALRPPGHHAESARAMGFCLFNNVALAARYAQRKYFLERVAILDWDVHHGNGTQEIFYEDGSVFFASVHQSPLFPYSGSREERGRGAGLGTTWNFPLPAGRGADEYFHVWDLLAEAVEDFNPQLIFISAGFDAHARDPLGGMELTARDFAQLTRQTKKWAAHLCDNRLICVLEGGYDFVGLGDSVAAVIRELLQDK